MEYVRTQYSITLFAAAETLNISTGLQMVQVQQKTHHTAKQITMLITV